MSFAYVRSAGGFYSADALANPGKESAGVHGCCRRSHLIFFSRGPGRGPNTNRHPYWFLENSVKRLIFNGSPGRIRTCDHSINSRMLYH